MNGLGQFFQGRRGNSLPMALIALTVGTLLVSPLLIHVSTGQRAVEEMERTLRVQYASDAGVEYAIWKVGRDASFRQDLMDNQGVSVDVDIPEAVRVNRKAPSVQMIYLTSVSAVVEDTSWVIWAESEIEIDKNNTTIYGDVHCNGDISITGNNTVVSGTVQYGTSFTPSPIPSYATWAPTHTCPITWTIAAFQVGGAQYAAAFADGKYYPHLGDWTPSEADDLVPGLHYCTGNVVIDDNNVNGENVTVVALGTIRFTKNKNAFVSPYVAGLSFFSDSASDQAICIDGNKFDSNGGTCFAPNGTIELSGNNATFTGAVFVADSVRIAKNDAMIQLPLEVGGSDPTASSACDVYDIQSTVDAIVTTVRISIYEDGSVAVQYWDVD